MYNDIYIVINSVFLYMLYIYHILYFIGICMKKEIICFPVADSFISDLNFNHTCSKLKFVIILIQKIRNTMQHPFWNCNVILIKYWLYTYIVHVYCACNDTLKYIAIKKLYCLHDDIRICIFFFTFCFAMVYQYQIKPKHLIFE